MFVFGATSAVLASTQLTVLGLRKSVLMVSILVAGRVGMLSSLLESGNTAASMNANRMQEQIVRDYLTSARRRALNKFNATSRGSMGHIE